MFLFDDAFSNRLYMYKEILTKDIITWVHPKSLSSLNDTQLSTINPRASSVIFRQNERSRLCKFLERLASDNAVLWPTCTKKLFGLDCPKFGLQSYGTKHHSILHFLHLYLLDR